MNNVLIINLKRNGDIFACSKLMGSLKAQYPDGKIHLLIFDEFIDAAKLLLMADQIHTISRKKIKLLKKNQIFSKAHALNTLFADLENLRKVDFDWSINYSNDKIGSYLIPFFGAKKTSGVSFTKNLTLHFSNSWALTFNDIITRKKSSPIHFLECYHKICELPYRPQSSHIKTDELSNTIVKQRFAHFKKKYAIGTMARFIGIHFKTSQQSRDIPVSVMVDFIDNMLKTGSFIPLILISNDPYEQTILAQINKKIDNKILSIKSDFRSLPSVLKEIDLLVCPDTSIKHLAELLGTPVLEVIHADAPIFKHGCTNKGNLIIGPKTLLGQGPSSETKTISGDDLFQALLYKYSIIKKVSLHSNNMLLKTEFDDHGPTFEVIAGSFDANEFINFHMQKAYLRALNKDKAMSDAPFIFLAKNYSNDSLFRWIDKEKKHISSMINVLFSTIRGLRKVDKIGNSEAVNGFIQSLNALLGLQNENTLANLALLSFKTKVDNIQSVDISGNIREMESFLYELKDNISQATSFLSKLSNQSFGKTVPKSRPGGRP